MPPARAGRVRTARPPDGQRINHPANIAATYAALAEIVASASRPLAVTVQENFGRCF